MANLEVFESALKNTLDLTKRIFSDIDRLTWEGEEKGVNRPAFSKVSENVVQSVLVPAARKAGATHILRDQAGNYALVWEGEDKTLPAVMYQSHFDSVVNGGRYDGMAGIVGGIAAINAQNESDDFDKKRTRVVFCNNGEESSYFGQWGMGSKMATAGIGPDVLKRTNSVTGKTLRHSMQEIGLDVEVIEAKLKGDELLLPKDAIALAVEIHIAQMPLKEKLAIMTSTAGNIRFPKGIRVLGEQSSEAAVALGYEIANRLKELRKDGPFVQSLPVITNQSNEGDRELATTTIKDKANVTLEFKVKSGSDKSAISTRLELFAQECASKWNCKIASTSFSVVAQDDGSQLYKVSTDIEGDRGHSGAQPESLRKDAGIAAVEIASAQINFLKFACAREVFDAQITRISNLASDDLEGKIHQDFKMSVLHPEVRGNDPSMLLKAHAAIHQAVEKIKRLDYDVEILVDDIVEQVGLMDPDKMKKLGVLLDKAGIAYTAEESKAGHDAGVFAQAGIPALLALFQDAGISHKPGETLGPEGENPYELGSSWSRAIEALHLAGKVEGLNSSVSQSFIDGMLERGAILIPEAA